MGKHFFCYLAKYFKINVSQEFNKLHSDGIGSCISCAVHLLLPCLCSFTLCVYHFSANCLKQLKQTGRSLGSSSFWILISVPGVWGIETSQGHHGMTSSATPPDLKWWLHMLVACKCSCLGYIQNEHNKILFPLVIHQQLHSASNSLQFSNNSLVQLSLLKT